MPTSANTVIIGNGQMATRCGDELLARGATVSRVISDGRRQLATGSLASWCDQKDIPLLETDGVNAPEVVSALRLEEPDLIFSINNFAILHEPLLELPQYGAVNFHNSPLPDYPGLDACSWAIINGEKTHGATWHIMDSGLDTGPIVARERFPIAESDTALSLTIKTVNAGVELFRTHVESWLTGSLDSQPQPSTSKRPRITATDGRLDFSWAFEALDCLVRGLSVYPLPTNLPRPWCELGGKRLTVRSLSRVSMEAPDVPCGTIFEMDGNAASIRIADAVIRLEFREELNL